jgi:hypothetical protein
MSFWRDPGIRVGIVAQRVHLLLAEKAVPARDRKPYHDAVARAKVFDLRADLDDFPHEFVSQNIALLHRRDQAVIQMEVGTADRGRSNFHHGVAPVD